MAKRYSPNGPEIDVEALKKVISAIESPRARRKRKLADVFSALYKDIRVALDEGTSKSAIINALAAEGASFSSKLFDELLVAEAQRRCKLVPTNGLEPVDDGPSAGSKRVSEASSSNQETT